MNAVFPALAVTFAIQAALAAGVYAPPVLAALAQQDIGVPASAVGIFTALAYLSATASSLVAGPLIARFGPVRVSQLCLVVSACGLLALTAANIALVLLAAILLGAGYGPATPASSQLLVALTPARLRATVLSLKQTGVPAGGIAVGAVLPALAFSVGWQGGAMLIALGCGLLAVVCEAVRAKLDTLGVTPGQARRVDILEPLRLARDHARLRQLAIVAFLYSGAQLCFATYLVIYLIEAGSYSLVVAGAGMSTFMLAGVLGRVVWGALADGTRRGRAVLAGLGAGSGVMALALIAMTPHWPVSVTVVVCFLCGFTAIAWNGVQLAEVARNAPDGRVAAATGMSMVFSYLGVVAAPLLFWLLHALTGGYPAGFALSAGFSFAGALVLMRR